MGSNKNILFAIFIEAEDEIISAWNCKQECDIEIKRIVSFLTGVFEKDWAEFDKKKARNVELRQHAIL